MTTILVRSRMLDKLDYRHPFTTSHDCPHCTSKSVNSAFPTTTQKYMFMHPLMSIGTTATDNRLHMGRDWPHPTHNRQHTASTNAQRVDRACTSHAVSQQGTHTNGRQEKSYMEFHIGKLIFNLLLYQRRRHPDDTSTLIYHSSELHL